MRQNIRDRSGRLLGYYEDDGISDRIVARDAGGRWLATYNKRQDETRDASGGLVGRGNLLAAFLVRP